MKPKETFNSQEELDECLKWWQEKLFLTDWIIKAKVCAPCGFILDEACGENALDVVNKCSQIRILDKAHYGDCIVKYCAEKILVHEILHCAYNTVDHGNTYEGQLTEFAEHALLEQMAKSLIMVKYGLGLDYFANTEGN